MVDAVAGTELIEEDWFENSGVEILQRTGGRCGVGAGVRRAAAHKVGRVAADMPGAAEWTGKVAVGRARFTGGHCGVGIGKRRRLRDTGNKSLKVHGCSSPAVCARPSCNFPSPRRHGLTFPPSRFSKSTFQTVLLYHGKSLHTLPLVQPPRSSLPGPLMTTSRIRQIQENCPNIRDLRFPVWRTGRSPGEAVIYQTLGVFTQFTNLELQLHLVEPDPESLDDLDPAEPDPELDLELEPLSDDSDAESESMPGPIYPPPIRIRIQIPYREILIRAAVDESLSRKIFTIIVTAGARSLQ